MIKYIQSYCANNEFWRKLFMTYIFFKIRWTPPIRFYKILEFPMFIWWVLLYIHVLLSKESFTDQWVHNILSGLWNWFVDLVWIKCEIILVMVTPLTGGVVSRREGRKEGDTPVALAPWPIVRPRLDRQTKPIRPRIYVLQNGYFKIKPIFQLSSSLSSVAKPLSQREIILNQVFCCPWPFNI